MKKIIFFVNHAAFFVSHRLNLAIAAKKKGMDVEIIIGVGASLKEEQRAIKILKKRKLKFKKFLFRSSETNIPNTLFCFLKIFLYIKKINPDIIHLISPKSILLGGVIAQLINIKLMVISISGMGYIFSNKLNFLEKIYKKLYLKILKYIFLHKNKKIIVQNKDDYFFFKKNFNLNLNEIVKIPGSGVDLKKFLKIKIKNNFKVVSLVGRIIEEKGILEYIEACKILKKIHNNWEFNLVGGLDYDKPSRFSDKVIQMWKTEKILNIYGYKPNIINFYSKSSIICLPSYREGMPKAILEASAAGRPVITTNTIGCKEAIINFKTGELCKVKSIKSLVQKLSKLIKNKKLREYYGKNGRALAIEKFDIKKITKKFLNIYKGE